MDYRLDHQSQLLPERDLIASERARVCVGAFVRARMRDSKIEREKEREKKKEREREIKRHR